MLLAAGHNWRPDHGPGRWAAASVAMVALHAVAVGAGLVTWQRIEPPSLPPAAVMVELMPMPVAPPATQTRAVSEPAQPKPELAPEPEPQFDLPIPEIDLTPPVFPKPEVVLPPPLPKKPKVEQVAEAPQEKPKEKPKDKPKEKPKEQAREKPKEKPKPAAKVDPDVEQASVEKPAPQSLQQAAASTAPVAPAIVPAAPSPADVARTANAKGNWEGLLQAHLRKHMKYPKSARRRNQEGTSFVFIRMSRDGKVLAHALETQSGYEALDEEAMALIERAQPLPPLPDDMPGTAIKFTVPINFNLTD